MCQNEHNLNIKNKKTTKQVFKDTNIDNIEQAFLTLLCQPIVTNQTVCTNKTHWKIYALKL